MNVYVVSLRLVDGTRVAHTVQAESFANAVEKAVAFAYGNSPVVTVRARIKDAPKPPVEIIDRGTPIGRYSQVAPINSGGNA